MHVEGNLPSFGKIKREGESALAFEFLLLGVDVE
jgi:hypothetical protein